MLLAVHAVNKQIRLYRVRIAWQQASGKDTVSFFPKINLQNIEMISDFMPTVQTLEGTTDMFMVQSSNAQLSHLELLAPASKIDSKETTSPCLIAVFSHVLDQYGASELRGQAFSILSRWDVGIESSTIHSSFSQLASKRGTSATGKKSKASITFSLCFRSKLLTSGRMVLGSSALMMFASTALLCRYTN